MGAAAPSEQLLGAPLPSTVWLPEARWKVVAHNSPSPGCSHPCKCRPCFFLSMHFGGISGGKGGKYTLNWVKLKQRSRVTLKSPFPPDYQEAFVINTVIIRGWVCFQTLSSVPLLNLFILAPVPHCLNHYSLKKKNLASKVISLLHGCLSCSWSWASC